MVIDRINSTGLFCETNNPASLGDRLRLFLTEVLPRRWMVGRSRPYLHNAAFPLRLRASLG
jgi:hypothetical protein